MCETGEPNLLKMIKEEPEDEKLADEEEEMDAFCELVPYWPKEEPLSDEETSSEKVQDSVAVHTAGRGRSLKKLNSDLLPSQECSTQNSFHHPDKLNTSRQDYNAREAALTSSGCKTSAVRRITCNLQIKKETYITSCAVCLAELDSKDMIKHVFSHFPEVTVPHLICKQCCKIFKGRTSYIKHCLDCVQVKHSAMETHSDVKDSFDRKVISKSRKRGRIKKQKNTDNKDQKQGTRIFFTRAECKKYFNSDSGSYNCNMCQETFCELLDFRCHLCFDKYKTRPKSKQLRSKDKSVRPNEKKYIYYNKNHSCHVCGKSFSHRLNLEAHIRTHTGEKPFTCDVCDKKFTQVGNLRRHKIVHAGGTPYQCNMCTMSFNQANNLKRHMSTHNYTKHYSCDICHKSFNHSHSLKSHKLIHSGSKPYVCDVCGKSFRQSSYLTCHKRIHSCEMLYKCGECCKSFTFSSALNIHKRIHTGERPYQCDVCGKSFKQLPNLKCHVKIHN